MTRSRPSQNPRIVPSMVAIALALGTATDDGLVAAVTGAVLLGTFVLRLEAPVGP